MTKGQGKLARVEKRLPSSRSSFRNPSMPLGFVGVEGAPLARPEIDRSDGSK